jgi:hypothetical protein
LQIKWGLKKIKAFVHISLIAQLWFFMFHICIDECYGYDLAFSLADYSLELLKRIHATRYF